MQYRCEATTVAGFVQQLAVAYVGHGYWFYVTGQIPEKKDPLLVDAKLIEKYGLGIGKATRARRKAAGLANIQYLRFKHHFILLATAGRHSFFEEEREFIRDAREVPIKFGGYAISYRAGHPHVRIAERKYRELKAYLSDVSIHRQKEWLEEQFRRLPFEPYAPVRSQLFGVLREVNRRRTLASFEQLPSSCIRVRRRVVRPFELVAPGEIEAARKIPTRTGDSNPLERPQRGEAA
ncbi:MAG: hypothetical protein IT167_23205 [Bryobacterales bacterium]|nr:hypothetical protein [Bryobacterales bacterium]